MRGLIRRKIRKVLRLLVVRPLNRLEVSVLEQEGAPVQRGLLGRALLHHEREDRLEVSCRGASLDPTTGIFLEKVELGPPEGVVVHVLLVLMYHRADLGGEISTGCDPRLHQVTYVTSVLIG